MSATVLVVDDDSGNRELLKDLLEPQGIAVVTAADGQRALEEFARTRPDLVLLDVNMPRLDGFQVCRSIKTDPESRLTPVVIITGLRAKEDRVSGIQAGADDFLSKPIERNELLARVRSLLSLKAFTDELERAESVLFALARSIEGKDPYTHGHCERLAHYSAELGKRIGLSQKQVEALQRAGIVHDIGKVAVPDQVLLKPGGLTPEERKIIEQHPVVGERICAPLKSFQLVVPIIRHHHERLDGSGYPDGLKGERIPITARVLQVVDVYDALTTDRPYRQALSPAEAFATMDGEVRRGWWDAALVAEFQKAVEVGALHAPAAASRQAARAVAD